MPIRPGLVVAWALLGLVPSPASARGGIDGPDFDRDVAPVLARRCLDCHGGTDPKGGLDLSARSAAARGGKHGPAIVPGQPDESPLLERVDADEMPPKHPLPEPERAVLRGWIAAGADWGTDPIDAWKLTTDRRAGRDWWALQPLQAISPPARQGDDRGPIDAFLHARLDAAGLEPAPEADRRTLIRRVTFDLTGLPPTPEEVAAFEADARPDAYERLVDRLLSSPRSGPRWARRWLDLARFGESNGFEHDEFRPDAWPYRDWVIAALDADLPYDEFIRLQLAGDVLHPQDPQAAIATGFLVAGAYDSVGQGQQSEAMRKVVRQDELEDYIAVVGQTVLGLTINCARCHDHKFDPIGQADYYRLAAALGDVKPGVRDLGPLSPPTDGRWIRQYEQAAPALGAAPVLAARRQAEPPRPAYVITPRPAGPTHRLLRGDPKLTAELLPPGGVAALASSGLSPEFGCSADEPAPDRRARLAAWLTDPRNPLTARVIVNRVWLWHFGTGFVDAPSDFGFNGGQPTHPELLDWLASDLIAHGWSLKHLHRQIVTSAAYRRSASPRAEALRVDAGNRLHWRKAPLRLEAEMVRDAMLSASGRLDLRPGGPGFREHAITQAQGTITQRYTAVEPVGPELERRSIYRTWARGGRSAFLDAFDCPDPSTTAPNRTSTNTPLQALTLLNDTLTLHLADRFAERLRREAGDDPGAQVDLAYRLALGRAPTDAERARAAEVVARRGAAVLGRVLFNANEFLYVD